MEPVWRISSYTHPDRLESVPMKLIHSIVKSCVKNLGNLGGGE